MKNKFATVLQDNYIMLRDKSMSAGGVGKATSKKEFMLFMAIACPPIII